MLKFIKGKGYQPSSERLKLQKELFGFSKTIPHGFPHRPSALSWDPKLQLMAIGTKTGLIRIYGSPGVEFSGQHDHDVPVLQIFFIPNQGRLISLLEGGTLHLWQIDNENGVSVLKEIKEYALENQSRKVSCYCVRKDGGEVLLGTESGNVYFLDLENFKVSEDRIICQDVIMQSVGDDFKVNPGAVEAIVEDPSNPNKILIGYNRGLIVLWDCAISTAEKTFFGDQLIQLESLSWKRDGTQFVSAHNDGSYVIWKISSLSKSTENSQTPYGPFPCKSINKLIWNTAKGNDFMVFTGGMPRATFGDRNTLSIMAGEKHQVLDFTSKVIDFFTITDSLEESEYDNPKALIVLVEEEIVAVDLLSEDWPQFKLPYLWSLHSSAITCSQHFSDVPEDLWNKIIDAGNKQSAWKYSKKEWPIEGGENLAEKSAINNLLVTGHEDGTVRFWDASGVALSHLYTLKTSVLFTLEDQEQSPNEEEEWPPFKKVGTFDPYSDDPRLAIKKVLMCVLSGILVVAGTAGQVIILDLKNEETEQEIEVSSLNIVGDRDSFVWKGHDQLSSRQGTLKLEQGYQPVVVVQLAPPAAVTALAFHTEWNLLAAGTAHGFGLYDFAQKKPVMAKCTLNPNDLAAVGDISMSRRKSFKKSLRESFRRLRKGRSQRNKREKTPTKEEPKTSSPKESRGIELSPTSPSIEAKPVERQIEARSQEDALGSMVRCLYLAQSFIINTTTTSPTLWAGTNSGAIFVFTITLPASDKRASDSVTCQLGKEIQLKHRAPVIAIQILDHTGYPLPEPLEIKMQKAKAPEMIGSHRVLICSEEQFKVFTLPSLKPYCKFKLTAHEGSRVRKVGMIKFNHRTDVNYSEYCMACLTNQGDISIYTVPDLRKQLLVHGIRKEDINGISSLVFTRGGQGFYLHSPCEVLRFSLSVKDITRIRCLVELPEGSRPKVDEEPGEIIEAEIKEEKEEKTLENVPEEDELSNSVAKIESSSTPEKKEKDVKTTISSPIVEVNGDKDASSLVETSLILKSVTRDINMSQEDGKLDITVDSIKDHLANLITTSEESSTVIIEKVEESRTIKTQETTVTMTSKSFSSETHTNSVSEGESPNSKN